MKKTLFLLLISVIAFASCEKDDVPDKGKLDPNAMILIKPAKGVQLRSTVSGLTALEVVQQATDIRFQTHYLDDVKDVARTFIEAHKDYDKHALLMWGTDIGSKERNKKE